MKKILLFPVCLLLGAALPWEVHGAEPFAGTGVRITADSLGHDQKSDSYEAKGNVNILWDGATLTADSALLRQSENSAVAEGNVVLRRGGDLLRGDRLTVNYATGNGTATAGSDYQAASGTLTFAPGETSKTITVAVNGDRLGEPDETFFVNLTAATGATISDGQGIGTIREDEPWISISDVTKAEGRKNHTTLFTFTVTLSAAYDQPITMSFKTTNGTATASSDYKAASGTLTFAPGEISKPITILVSGDRLSEPNETFYVNLSNPTNAVLATSQATAVIANDDPYPLFAVNDVKITEGASGAKSLGFTVSLSSASTQTVSANYTTVDGTARAGSEQIDRGSPMARTRSKSSSQVSSNTPVVSPSSPNTNKPTTPIPCACTALITRRYSSMLPLLLPPRSRRLLALIDSKPMKNSIILSLQIHYHYLKISRAYSVI